MSRYRDDDDRPRTRGRDDDDRPARRSRDDDDDRPRRRGRDDDEDKPRRSFSYAGRGQDQVRRRSEQGGNDFDKFLLDSVKMFKVNDGNNTVRFLPPTWDKPDHYGLDVYVHYGVGPDRQTYLCLHKMKGEPCPVCEERQEAQRNGDEKYAKELEPKKRVLTYVVDRDHEKDGVQAWASPWTVDRDISKVSTDRRTGEVYAIDHPDEGFDVEFEKKGSKDRTEYLGVAIARRATPLGKDAWLEFAIDNPLPTILKYYDYDHIAKVFNGGGAPRRNRDDDDAPRGRSRDDDDRPARRSRDDDAETPRRRSSGDDDAPRGRDRSRDDDDDKPLRREPARDDADSDNLSWDDIHGMKSGELDDLIELKGLNINPSRFDSDEDLADEICSTLGIKKATARRRASGDDDDRPARRSSGDDDDEPRGRLAEMRRSRER